MMGLSVLGLPVVLELPMGLPMLGCCADRMLVGCTAAATSVAIVSRASATSCSCPELEGLEGLEASAAVQRRGGADRAKAKPHGTPTLSVSHRRSASGQLLRGSITMSG
tara:strand:+ start:373 stop:699 length:327 start_codon:yes stop_codon:yes gene_type:complete